MKDSGQGYLADLAVFAIMIALACTMLARAGPVRSETEVQAYAVNLAQSTLLAFQHSTVEEVGNFTYELSTSCTWGSTERRLQHKTFAQLLVEDAFCNLHIEVDGHEIAFDANQDLDKRVREFMRGVLDEVIGGRFGYKLTVRAEFLQPSRIRMHFLTEIERLPDGGHQLCSETLVMNFPIPQEWLGACIQDLRDAEPLEFGSEIVVEITLELWSE